MGDDTVKIPTAFLWPAANADRKAESAFHVVSQWRGLPFLHEGTDYRIIDKSNAIPTIEILAAPASNAFWKLQGEALAGKIRLDHTPLPSTPPLSPFDLWETIKEIGSGIVNMVVGAHTATAGMLERSSPRWHVTGDGPWSYAKESSFDSGDWNGPTHLVVGSLVTVDGKFSGKPCGNLILNDTTFDKRIALSSSASNLNYIYRAKDPDQRIRYDESTGQYYVESISGKPITHVDVDVYRRQDVQLRTPLNAPRFVNTSRTTVRGDQLSPFTQGIFDKARKLAVPEGQQLQWAAQKMAASWQYDDSPELGMLRMREMPEKTYKQLHQPDGVMKAHCQIAATEFFHAARAYGYNVRLVVGQMDILDVDGHAWVEFGDAEGIHVVESTPAAAERAREIRAQTNFIKQENPPEDNIRDHHKELMNQALKLLGLAPDYYYGEVATLTSIQPLIKAIHAPVETVPQRSTVPPELRKIFDNIAFYVDNPDKTLALKPEEAVRVASVEWGRVSDNDLRKMPSFQQGLSLAKILLEGLPEEIRWYDASTARMLSFFNAARAYGYSVTLNVGINDSYFYMRVRIQGKEGSETLFDTFYHGRSPNEDIEMEGRQPLPPGISNEYQRIAWMDLQAPGIRAFLTTMQGQLPKSDAEVFAEFTKSAASIAPILRAYETTLPWTSQFHSAHSLDSIEVSSSQYTLPNPPQEKTPDDHSSDDSASKWTKLNNDYYSQRQMTGYEFQNRSFEVPYDDVSVVPPPKNAVGKEMTVEELVNAAFQHIERAGDRLYYSPKLDVLVNGKLMSRLIMKDAQGQLISFQWQFPETATINRLIPILRADLTEGKQGDIKDVGQHRSGVKDVPVENYDALSPLLLRFMNGIRKDGGLRSPKTDAEKMQIVTLYHLILKMGVVRDVKCYSYYDAKSRSRCDDDVQKTVAMMVVMIEYQKLWEQNKGNLPEAWIPPDCARIERDHIPTDETFCLPRTAHSPEAGVHREWMRQLARELFNAKYTSWPADIQNVITASQKWR